MKTKFPHNYFGLRSLAGLFFVSLSFVSCAQSKNLVKNVHAFYVERLPGNIPSNTTRIRIDTIITVYLETNTKLITWDSAFKKGAVYLIRPVLIEQVPFEVGTKKKSIEKIIITPEKGLFLWQLSLEPVKRGLVLPTIKKTTWNEIILNGRYKGRKLIQKVDKIVELEGIPSV